MELIKKGSKGIVVGTWQEFLKNLNLYKYSIDNDFGNLTHNATIKFQTINGLFADGIVGQNTWNKAYELGIITTDEMEEPIVPEDFNLSIKKALMPKDEYYTTMEKKEWLFLHHTAGWNNPFNTISNWANDNRGRVATEFVLGGQKITDGNTEFDGVIAPLDRVCNFGFLYLGGYYKNVNGIRTWIKGKANNFYTYVGTEVLDNQVTELKKEFRGHKYWHKYSDKQIKN
jgi:hypothetical protein